MQHALMYQGSFDQNFPTLAPGATSFHGSDGSEHPLPEWPSSVNGVRIGYLEKPGKKFVAARLQFEDHDIVLKNPVLLDQMRHLGSRRFSPEPTEIGDDLASNILDDAIAKNPEQQQQIALLINRVNQVRRATRGE